MTSASTAATTAENVIETFEALPRLAAADSDLAWRGRFLTCEMEIGIGSVPLSVAIVEGCIASVKRGPFLLKPFTFAIRAEADVWRRFHEPCPAPGWHDLLALTKTGRARIEGNLVPMMGNLQFIKDLIALPRVLHLKGSRT